MSRYVSAACDATAAATELVTNILDALSCDIL